nr:basic proline-rich protein-like [Manis javanica]
MRPVLRPEGPGAWPGGHVGASAPPGGPGDRKPPCSGPRTRERALTAPRPWGAFCSPPGPPPARLPPPRRPPHRHPWAAGLPGAWPRSPASPTGRPGTGRASAPWRPFCERPCSPGPRVGRPPPRPQPRPRPPPRRLPPWAGTPSHPPCGLVRDGLPGGSPARPSGGETEAGEEVPDPAPRRAGAALDRPRASPLRPLQKGDPGPCPDPWEARRRVRAPREGLRPHLLDARVGSPGKPPPSGKAAHPPSLPGPPMTALRGRRAQAGSMEFQDRCPPTLERPRDWERGPGDSQHPWPLVWSHSSCAQDLHSLTGSSISLHPMLTELQQQ